MKKADAMSGKTLFCFGYGYTAKALARRLAPLGWSIAGTTRSPEKAGAMTASGVQAHVWDGGAIDAGWLDGATAVLVSTAPNAAGCPAHNAAGEALSAQRERVSWIGYLSTNGVYGDHGGAWVDEESNLFPTTERARRRIRAAAGEPTRTGLVRDPDLGYVLVCVEIHVRHDEGGPLRVGMEVRIGRNPEVGDLFGLHGSPQLG